MTGQDEREAIDRGDEQVKIIADAWMLHQGYTQEEIEASVDDLDHSLCEMIPGVGWDCMDEDGSDRHPEYVALCEASEMANVALDALAQAGFHLTPTAVLEDAGPEAGHTFEVSVRSRGSAGVLGGPKSDANWWGDPSVVRVRAWNLPDAVAMASTIPYHKWGSAPTAEVKAEALAQIIEPLLVAHGTKSRNAYYVRCRCGCSEMGSYLGEKPTLHEHKAQVIAKAIATHLRENRGA